MAKGKAHSLGPYLVDWDVDELDEEADEAHHEEPNSGGEGHFCELSLVGLLASGDEVSAVLVELPGWMDGWMDG